MNSLIYGHSFFTIEHIESLFTLFAEVGPIASLTERMTELIKPSGLRIQSIR